MVEIMYNIHQVCPELKLYLLGAGDNVYAPMREEMDKCIKEYQLEDVIILLPWLNHDEALSYLKYARLYLSTSRYEGLPIAVIEALALEKAVVASDVIGNRSCVEDGGNGYLLPLNVDAFVDKILYLIEDKKKRREMELNSRHLFERNFVITKNIEKLEIVYKKIHNS